MKYEWKKEEKDSYPTSKKPSITTIEKTNYITYSGSGNPNSDAFQHAIETLYALSYGVKMTMKKQDPSKDYTVYPLEGYWDLSDQGRELYQEHGDVSTLKDFLVFTLMIKQPPWITKAFYEQVKDTVKKKKPHLDIHHAAFMSVEDGLVGQILHVGSYDDEPESFKALEEYLTKEGYTRTSKAHKEIYLSDARRVEPSKLKTILRVSIKKM